MGDVEKQILNVHSRIAEIDAAAWDSCAQRAGDLRPGCADPKNPFVSHAFLHALEESGSVAPRTGWMPQHLVLRSGDAVLACMPCYLKGHSQGEYVFDHAWANAYMQAGGRYYPKLQCAVPFTPVTGPRLLVRPGVDTDAGERTLIAGALHLTERREASSLHVTFPTEAEWTRMGAMGLLLREDRQYHWINEGYADFDDFLARLSSRKRKAIRKERRDAKADGLRIERLIGADITEAHWDAFFDFYTDTGSRKWGRPYLNREFFSLVGQSMPDAILLVMCLDGDRPIAGALNFIGADTLYGRNWGAIDYRPGLHFEACYYQAIEFAIERQLGRVEAGAQGEHKLARGYLPQRTFSAHYIADEGLRSAVAKYLVHEREAVAAETEFLQEDSPYRKCD